MLATQQTQDAETNFVSVADGGSILNHQCLNVWCLLEITHFKLSHACIIKNPQV